MTAVRDDLMAACEALGYPPSCVPGRQALYHVKNGEASPSLVLVAIIRAATGGAVGFDDWLPDPEAVWERSTALMVGGPDPASEPGARRA